MEAKSQIRIGTGKILKYDKETKRGVIANKKDGKLYLFSNEKDELDTSEWQSLIVQFAESATESGNPLATNINKVGVDKSAK